MKRKSISILGIALVAVSLGLASSPAEAGPKTRLKAKPGKQQQMQKATQPTRAHKGGSIPKVSE